ncbi:GNAT family N-acetyltransferase [Arcticibacter sp. MXS-1]|uniref:GNAT family N-acetyltransferase n=1 Tax=Arcticibacter sp. MXS-1 TaxID=3341726 RepID=UPI0035A838B6
MDILTKVELAFAKDFKEITDVWEASVRATHHFLLEADILFYRPLIENEYLHSINVFLVRERGGSIAGFIGTFAEKIEMLFIRPDCRGKKIGKTLVEYAIATLGASKVDVNEQNMKATGFYLHMGFRVLKRSELDAMGKPYPLLHMEL